MKIITSVLLVTFIIAGCSGLEAPPKATEILPGVYMSDEPGDFPLPTSGYTVYIVGETHGNKETKTVFQVYLQRLYEEADLRDVILEEDQAYETDANAYVQGLTDELVAGLCLRMDILGQIRDFNAAHPDDEQVTLHLVDVDSPFPIIYKHLTELHSRLAPAADGIPLPSLDEFASWDTSAMYEWIAKLQSAAKDQPDILNGLETVQQSIQWYLNGNEVDTGPIEGAPEKFFPHREDVITQNMQYVLEQLEGRPVLAFFGAAHGMKNTMDLEFPLEGFESWGERLHEANVSVYSLNIDALSGGGYWRGDSFAVTLSGDDYQFEDGSSLVSLFKANPEGEILFADLRAEENSDIRLSSNYPDTPASQSYDGLILFKQFTPMENACPP